MLRILRQFILTTVFAIFASQASAMFIQPDWLDPTKPGVGTNRYSYSHNDPINKMDPNGNEAVAAAGLGLGFLGLATAEYASDLFNDGDINGNGLIGGGIHGVASVIGDAAQGIFDDDSIHDDTSSTTTEDATTTEEKKEETTIYRSGSGTNTNLTPREVDVTGLSFSLGSGFITSR